MIEWYEIYGHRFYDINVNTGEIRSHKHFKSDPHHIMKVRNGYVTVTDDYGKSHRVSPKDLYIQTFNMGHKLVPMGSEELNAGGMQHLNRNFNISMDYSKFVNRDSKTESRVMVKPFKLFINEKQ